MFRLPTFAVVSLSLFLASAVNITPAHAAQQHVPLSACAEQLSQDFSNDREARGFDGVVTPDQAAEFTRECRQSPATAWTKERDAVRCVNRRLLWARAQDAVISEQEMARVTAACRASARPIAPANAALPGFARNRGNLLTHARTARFYPALAPRGSSGLADVPPQGNYQSTSDGGYASTAVNVGNLSFTTLLVDLTTDRAILCRERINGGNRTYATNWSAFYYFDDQPMIERTGRCPVSLWEYPPETLLDWRQHLLKIPSGKAAPASAGAIQQPVAPIAGLKSFGGHCNGFTLAGREYMEPGRCPEGVSLFLPAAGDRGKPRLTIKTPARGAPTLVFQLDQAVQGYINNDIVTFDASPISGLPFSWSAYDRLQCVFVKSPSDAAGAAGSRHQPSATINCSFQGNPLRDADKLIFGFFADQADIPAFRAAFIAAHDQLNPGRPFVSPAPDMRTPQPN